MKNTSSRTFMTRTKRNKIYRNRRLTVILLSLLCIFIISFIIRSVYIKSCCKELDFAVEHYLTSNNSDDCLVRVKTMNLVFSDKDKAVVQAFGLSKKEPHSMIGVEGHFKKNNSNSWKLESTYSIENSR